MSQIGRRDSASFPKSILLNKYQRVKILGSQGNNSKVYEVKYKENTYAIKLLTKNAYTIDNLSYVKSLFKNIYEDNSKYTIKIFDIEQDEYFTYILQEKCDFDIQSLQQRCQDKTFSLSQALHISKYVIKGILEYHQQSLVHRSIKPNNIFVIQTDKSCNIKISSSQFGKRIEDLNGTIIGNEHFISPEQYKAKSDSKMSGRKQVKKIGFQIDVWAFGISLCYMLNRQYPFKISPNWPPQVIYEQLNKLCLNFSYRAFVSKSKLRKFQNCNQMTQDFFKRVFEIDVEKRITMKQIMTHPLFKSLFKNPEDEEEMSTSFQEEETLLIKTISDIVFIHKFVCTYIKQINNEHKEELYISCYTMLKYVQDYLVNIKQELKRLYPHLIWNLFWSSKRFTLSQNKLSLQIVKNEFQQKQLKRKLLSISNNEKVQDYLRWVENTFEDKKSTIIQENLSQMFFEALRTIYKSLNAKEPKTLQVNYLISCGSICYAFKCLTQDTQLKIRIFKDYVQTADIDYFSFGKVLSRLDEENQQDVEKIMTIAKATIKELERLSSLSV